MLLLLLILIVLLILIHFDEDDTAATIRIQSTVRYLPTGPSSRLRSDKRYSGRIEISEADTSLASYSSIVVGKFLLECVRHLAGIATRFTARDVRYTLQSLEVKPNEVSTLAPNAVCV